MKKNCKPLFILVGILLIIIVILLIINNSIYAKRKNIIEKFEAEGAATTDTTAPAAPETPSAPEAPETQSAPEAPETPAAEPAAEPAKSVINYATCNNTHWGGTVLDNIKNFCCNDTRFLQDITAHTKKNERSVKYSHAAALCDKTTCPVQADKKILPKCKYHTTYIDNQKNYIDTQCNDHCKNITNGATCSATKNNDFKVTLQDKTSITAPCWCMSVRGKCMMSDDRKI